ncbi:MAG TPA: four helix bundle protein [Verrucomicrobiae bacterium]|nr:four helix bundle protein [Verrucomicrobiae bacterium]
MPKINTYKDLLVWQMSHELAKEVLDACEKLNGSVTAKEIAGQMIRSSTSVPANIAEGFGGRIGKEYVSFLFQARRSLTETDYWILLAAERGLIDKNKAEKLQSGYLELTKMLNAIIRKIGERERR